MCKDEGPHDRKGMGGDTYPPPKKKKQAPPLSDFEQIRNDALGSQDRVAYIMGDAPKKQPVRIL